MDRIGSHGRSSKGAPLCKSNNFIPLTRKNELTSPLGSLGKSIIKHFNRLISLASPESLDTSSLSYQSGALSPTSRFATFGFNFNNFRMELDLDFGFTLPSTTLRKLRRRFQSVCRRGRGAGIGRDWKSRKRRRLLAEIENRKRRSTEVPRGKLDFLANSLKHSQ